jgi:hypothetical protein
MTTMQPPYQPVPPSFKPLELSFPLPKYPHTTLHIHLTILATSTLLFLTTTSPGDSSNGGGGGGSAITKPMGSFVYAMPDVRFLFLFIIYIHIPNPFLITPLLHQNGKQKTIVIRGYLV